MVHCVTHRKGPGGTTVQLVVGFKVTDGSLCYS